MTVLTTSRKESANLPQIVCWFWLKHVEHIEEGLRQKNWQRSSRLLWGGANFLLNRPRQNSLRSKELNQCCPPNISDDDDLCLCFCVHPSSMMSNIPMCQYIVYPTMEVRKVEIYSVPCSGDWTNSARVGIKQKNKHYAVFHLSRFAVAFEFL